MVAVSALARPIAGWRLVRRRRARRTLAFYAFIAPWLLGFVVLTVVPLILGFLTSLTNYDGLNLASLRFLGLANYRRILSDADARFALGRTLLWSAINTPLWLVCSFTLALILNQEVRGRGLFRTLYYLPSVIPAVAAVWAWKIILDRNYGLINGLLSVFQPGTAIPWLSEYALYGVTAIALWSGLGSGMVIFLAGLQGIPEELIEAARIDGAGTGRIFRHITIPLMTPVIFFQLVMALISSFQQFVIPLLLTTSGAQGAVTPRSVYLYMIHTYRQLFTYQRFGYGVALLWVLFVVVMALTVLVFRSASYWVYYEALAEEGRGR